MITQHQLHAAKADAIGTVPMDPPGPGGLRRLLALLRMARDPLRTSVTLFDKYGDFVQLGSDGCITRDPYVLEEIAHDYLSFGKNFLDAYGEAGIAFWGQGTGVRSDPEWIHHRRLIHWALRLQRIEGYAHAMVCEADHMLDGWEEGMTFDLLAELKRMTLRIIIRNQFGMELDEDEFEDTFQSLEAVMVLFEDLSQLELTFDTPEKAGFREAIARLDEIVYRVIDRRRRESEDRGDMLFAWMAAEDEAGRKLDDVQLRDELVAHLRAGYRNSATVLCWTFALLDNHPKAEAKLADEVRAALGTSLPQASILGHLPYAEQVLKEAMRLYPLYPMLGRRVTRDTVLSNYRLPEGMGIGISVWAMHRDPRWFQAPEQFQPERWTEALERSLPRHAFFAFGGGQRQCPFKSYGMMECTLLLAMVMQRYRIRLADGEQAEPHATVNGLMPRGGLQVVVEARD